MSARDDILSAIRMRRVGAAAKPTPYTAPAPPGDPVECFAAKARAVQAEVRVLKSMAEVPDAVADILRARNMEAKIHLPPDSRMHAFAWSIETDRAPPGPDDAAVSIAPCGIAETGTLAFASSDSAPASWHFRPGLEIAVLAAGDILPRLEDVFARIKAAGALPHTVNLVTGPSRTGDIEQTLELGAHGPKTLCVLVIRE